MAADCFKINYAKSNGPKYMENSHKSGASENIMKIVSQHSESPPPKPARRRYSDQSSSCGTLSSNKRLGEENNSLRNESRLKVSSAMPAYLSLPTNLTSNPLSEQNNISVFSPHSGTLFDQLKYTKDESYLRNSLDKCKCLEINTKPIYINLNKFDTKERLYSLSQGTNTDHMFAKYQYGNSASYLVDRLTKSSSSVSSSKVFIGNNQDYQNLRPPRKNCHRRHHSDPAISHFTLTNQGNCAKSETQGYDTSSCSSKKLNKCCHSTTSCCKKNYFIMQEIQVLKEINEKLWQQLCSVQTCLENVRKKAFEECSDVSISGLLSSMYYAQRAKDCAMEERLKIALEERDAALLELEDMIHVMTKSFDSTDEVQCAEKELDEGIKELLHEIGCSANPSRLLKYQRLLLARICNFKESKQDCLSQELKRTIAERDNALEKVSKLEEEVKSLKMCYDLWHLDNKHWELALFDILRQLLQQRDNVLSKVDDLDFSSILCRSIESKSHPAVVYNDSKMHHSFNTSDEVNKLKEEVSFLNKALENELKKREQTEGKCVRLERLIHILRKKLNGQNVGVLV